MDRGSYIAASGGLLQMKKLEVQNHNLSNINTVGFKRQYLTSESQPFDDTFAHMLAGKDPYAKPDHDRTQGVQGIRTQIDFTPGAVRDTGNPLDAALRNPNDFFVVNTPEGPTYTRAGNFMLGPNGELQTADGFDVQGDGGPILINGTGASIGGDGTIRAGGQNIGRLQVVRFNEMTDLEATGGARFKLKAGAPQPTGVDVPGVVPGALEMSNVSAVSSMVDLIVTNRAFEAYTKAAQTIDGMNQTAITQVGRRQ